MALDEFFGHNFAVDFPDGFFVAFFVEFDVVFTLLAPLGALLCALAFATALVAGAVLGTTGFVQGGPDLTGLVPGAVGLADLAPCFVLGACGGFGHTRFFATCAAVGLGDFLAFDVFGGDALARHFDGGLAAAGGVVMWFFVAFFVEFDVVFALLAPLGALLCAFSGATALVAGAVLGATGLVQAGPGLTGFRPMSVGFAGLFPGQIFFARGFPAVVPFTTIDVVSFASFVATDAASFAAGAFGFGFVGKLCLGGLWHNPKHGGCGKCKQ